MYAESLRAQANALHNEGLSIAAIHRRLGVSRAAIAEWLAAPEYVPIRRTCFVCEPARCPHPATYAYLLGQYLGDGYLVTTVRVPRLRIACADAYPQIASLVDDALTTLSGNRVSVVHGIGCSDHGCYWMHWPCLFPQHGPGRKHLRTIELTAWQQATVDEDPWPLIRGLIHSDGCRAINRVVVRGKSYEYPRYFFSNASRDILAIMGAALDRAGVAWRLNRPNSVSIARREAVELMERHVGPKT